MTKPKEVTIALTKQQRKILRCSSDFYLVTGGMGSGKTYFMCILAVILARHSPDVRIAIYEPTYELVRDVLLPTMEEVVENEFGYTGHYHQQSKTYTPHIPGCGVIKFRTMDNPRRIVGSNVYACLVDEIDTMNKDKAQQAFKKITARARQKPKGVPTKFKKWNKAKGKYVCRNLVALFTTPEGYEFCYSLAKKKDGTYRDENDPEFPWFRMSTRDNPYTGDVYADRLASQYTDKECEAYIEGFFRDMTSGSVYYAYDRTRCDSREDIKPDDVLYVGMDFNVRKMAAVIYVKRFVDDKEQWHAVRSHTGMENTPATIQLLKEEYPDNYIKIYPDATGARGDTRSHTGAPEASDIALLEEHFEVIHNPANPRIKNRVQTMNVGFEKGWLFVNQELAPEFAECLEKQVYDKNGQPDKSNDFDHPVDAGGYPIAYEFEMTRPVARLEVIRTHR